MKAQVIQYIKTSAPKEFVDDVLEMACLSERDKEIFWQLRRGNVRKTEDCAEQAGLPRKLYDEVCRTIFRRVMCVLIQLAEDGWKAKRHSNGE